MLLIRYFHQLHREYSELLIEQELFEYRTRLKTLLTISKYTKRACCIILLWKTKDSLKMEKVLPFIAFVLSCLFTNLFLLLLLAITMVVKQSAKLKVLFRIVM